MLRQLGFAFETLAFGLNLGRFKYYTRSPRPIEPEYIWEQLATPSPGLRWFEEAYPRPLHMRAIIGLNALSMLFQDHQSGIRKHYDVSNDFFGLFLDTKYRFYSAAEFTSPSQTLEEAQERKAQLWLSLIDPQPGERILDAGSGWGGMLNLLRQVTQGKTEVIGYTLSEEQKQYTAQTFGLHVELKDFVTTEYPDHSFDKIYAIETFEHVRRRELFQFARKLRRAMKPRGRLVFQITCLPDEVPPPSALFAGLDTFPGSEGTPIRDAAAQFERAGFRIRQLNLLDYRPTLRAWFTRLASNQEAAVAMLGVKDYMRYLCYLPAAWRLFEARELYLARFVLESV